MEILILDLKVYSVIQVFRILEKNSSNSNLKKKSMYKGDF